MVSILKTDKIQASHGSTIEIPSGHVLQAPGHTLQTLYLAMTTVTTTTSTSFGLMAGSNLAITPSSTSSKILIQYNYAIYVINGNNNTWRGGKVRLMNVTADSVLHTDTDYGTVLYSVDGGDRSMGFSSGAFLHSPSTTSAITYGLECASALNGNNVIFNNTGYSRGGHMLLQEIAG